MIYYILFIIIILLLPYFFFHKKALNKNEAICIFIAAITHITISIIDAKFGSLLSSVVDTDTFYSTAMMYLENGQWNKVFENGAYFYSAILSVIFAITGPDILLSNLTSTFFSIFACVLFANSLKLVKIEKNYILILLLIFSFLPGLLYFGSITLRESLQLLTIMASVFYLLKIHIYKRISIIEHVIFIVSTIILGMLHHALMYISSILFFIYIYKILKSFLSYIKVSLLLTGLISVIILMNIDNINVNQLFENINQYRLRAEQDFIGNTNYYILIDDRSFFSSLFSIGQIYITYMFKPLFYEIHNLSTFCAAAESLLRLILIVIVMYSLIYKRRENCSMVFLLLVFIATSFMWSIGTFNFGQAVRHHVITNWLLLLIGSLAIKNIKLRNDSNIN